MDQHIGEFLLADYLLWTLNKHGNREYLRNLSMTEPIYDLNELLLVVSDRLGMIGKGAKPNLQNAARSFLKRYRMGCFGKMTLDDLT